MMAHLTTDEIFTYLDGKASDTEKGQMDAHMASCAECMEEKEEIRALEFRIRIEPKFTPTAEDLQELIDLFPAPPEREPDKPSLPRMIVALLAWDNFDQPMFAGARAVGAPTHPLVFRADDIGVEVRIKSTEANGQITLSGHLVSSRSGRSFDNASVALESHGAVRYQTTANDLGEFSFQVPADSYDLSIDLVEGHVTIPNVHPGSARS